MRSIVHIACTVMYMSIDIYIYVNIYSALIVLGILLVCDAPMY